jgi:hypothetical protein
MYRSLLAAGRRTDHGHPAFALAEAPRIRKNLNALVKVLRGGGRPEPAALLAAWQTLFLVVPVVSSTFASAGRLFAGLGRESLGWLLIDEAGQAAPQNAAGALLRSRSASATRSRSPAPSTRGT